MNFWRLYHPPGEKFLGFEKTEYGRSRKEICAYHSYVKVVSVAVEVKTAAALRDFVWCWTGGPYIRDSVLRLFRENGLTGFDVVSKSVSIKPREGARAPRLRTPLPKYWRLIVTGFGGMTLPGSGIKLRKQCICGVTDYTGWKEGRTRDLLDESQWDGSDFFMIWPLGYIFVNDRAAEVIRSNKLTGCRLIAPEDMDVAGSSITGGLEKNFPSDKLERLQRLHEQRFGKIKPTKPKTESVEKVIDRLDKAMREGRRVMRKYREFKPEENSPNSPPR